MAKYTPVPILPFRLHDISDFVVDHPILFPESIEYDQYWTQEAEYVIYGKWGLDKNKETSEGGYRWMPGNLYFYINNTIIKDEDDDSAEVFIRPRLRDIEWLIFYALITCDGFSGFDGDEEYTCYRPVGKLERGIELTNQERILLEKNRKTVYNSKGELKKYKESREYLYQTFDKPMGKPMFRNEALNLILLSSRGIGKSYSISNGVIAYDFCTNGATSVKQFFAQSTTSTIVVGSEDSKKSRELLEKFEDAYEYIRTSVGAYNKDGIKQNGAFYWAKEGSLASGSNNPFNNAPQEKGGGGKAGPGSKIVHVSYKNNPNAGVGYRARRMIVEEAGLLVHFKSSHAENSATQKRKTKFGYTVYIGTGGNIEKIKEIREAFYDPEAYDCLAFPDIYNGTDKPIGLFVPSYFRNDLYRDPQGNMDYLAAFEDEMNERESKKRSGSDAYEGYMISYPIVPQEMFLNNSGNIYPTDALEDNLHELESGRFRSRKGQLYYIDENKTSCYWEEDVENALKYINRYGDEKKMRSLKTGIQIFEPPIDNKPIPNFRKPLYLVLYDPIHKDGEGSSLAVAFVFKFWDLDNPDKIQFNVVAEWIGRYPMMEDNHEQALKLATYYGAKILPEFNGDFVRYCRMTNRHHMLQPRPGLAIDGFIKQKASYDVGVYVSPGMIPDMEQFSLEVLNKPIRKKERIEGNLYIEELVRMVHELPSMRLTEELLYYSRDGNFDYVSAFQLLGLVVRQIDIEPVKRESEDKVRSKEESISKYYRNQEIMNSFKGNTAFNY